MTRDDIIHIRMVDDAGLTCLMEAFQAELERIVHLARAAEREECAKLCEEYSTVEGIAQQCAEAIRTRGKK